MRFRHSVLIAVTFIVGACGENTPLSGEGNLLRSHLTGAAAAALDANGQFVLDQSPAWQREELDAAAAESLSDVYVRTFAPTAASLFERAHGGPINFDNLTRCGRVLYGETPYEMPESNMPDALLNFAASRWFVSYCDGALPVLSIAVAATATHVRIVNGRFDPMSLRGGEFDKEGIPRGSTAPMSPEAGATLLANESGRRIAAVPRLILPGVGYFAQSGRWLLELESPVSSEASNGRSRAETRYFVGRSLRTWDLELSRAENRERGADTLRGPGGVVYAFVRRAGHRARWEQVTFGGR